MAETAADAVLDANPADAALDRRVAPPPAPPASAAAATPADQLLKQVTESQKKTEGILAAEQREKAPVIDAALAENAKPGPAVPKLERESAPPKADMQKQMQDWLMPMVALSAIAGAFSRQHATTALNAFAAGVQGLKEGNLQLYDQKLKEWKAANEQLLANNDAAMKEYNAAWNNKKLNIDQKMNEIQLISAKYQDQLTYEASAQKNFTLVAQMLQKQETLTEKMKMEYEKLKLASEAAEAKLEAVRSKMESSDPFVMAQRLEAIKDPEQRKRALQMIQTLHPQGGILFGDGDGSNADGFAGLSNAAIDERAKMWVAGNFDGAFKGIGGSAIGSRLRNIISSKGAELAKEQGVDPNDASIDYTSRKAGAAAGARTAATREEGLKIILRAADAAIPAALEQSEKVWRTGFVPLNKIIQRGQVATSDPDLRQFGMANLQLAEHWAKAMNPTGVMRVDDRQLALDFLSTADSKDTYQKLVKQLRTQIQRELTAVQSGKTHPGATAQPGGAAPSEGGGGAGGTMPPPGSGGASPDPLGIR